METPEKGLSVLTWNFVERREKRRSKERFGGTAVLTLLPAITVTVSTKAEMSEGGRGFTCYLHLGRGGLSVFEMLNGVHGVRDWKPTAPQPVPMPAYNVHTYVLLGWGEV